MFNNKFYVKGDQNVQVPAHLNFGKYLLDHLRTYTDKVAFENGQTGQQLTYGEIAQYAVDLAIVLIDLGVSKGDVVALGSEKRIDFVPTAIAILLTGATYTPYDLKSGRAILNHQISITQPKYFICSHLFWQRYSDAISAFHSILRVISLDEVDDSIASVKSLIKGHGDVDSFEPVKVQGQVDTAFILYSSGTTGMPKGVQLTHLNCMLNSLPNDFVDPDLKTAFVVGEWNHNYDTFMTYKMLSQGRKIVFIENFTHEEMLKCFKECKVNVAFLVPSLVYLISKTESNNDCNGDSLKVLYSRSSPLHAKTVEKVKQRFPSVQKVLQGYGMTEAGELTSENWGTDGPRSGSVGKPSPGITLKVVNPATNEVLGPNEQGEIRLRGPVFMKGYIGVDPATFLDEEGFFKTGDLGYYDDDKYFYIVDRMKEIISYDGNKIAPLELETILLLHPAVREAGVVGKPVPIYGEEPTAFVVTVPGSAVTEQELLDYVASEVAPYMQLRGGVQFIPQLPRNPRGKILRRRLRELLTENI